MQGMLPNSNASYITENRVKNLFSLTKRTMDILIEQVDEGTLTSFKSPQALVEFHNNVESILVAKIKSKFKLS